jgi:biotin-[acetyl-CoA-carboxylase] ligase BirA-like protein
MNDSFTPLEPSNFTLNDACIDIWCFPLSIEFPGAHKLLSDDENIRAKRFHFPRHQRRFTVARAVLRLILSRYLNVAPASLIFTTNKYGKPLLVNDPSWHFNISHSGEMALLAVSKHHPMGIDLEYFSKRPYEGIAKSLFSPKEIQALEQAPRHIKPLVFFHTWSQKESFIKACGMGLSYPTQQFDVPILNHDNQRILDKLNGDLWHITSFMPEVACSGALCYHPSIKDIRYAKLGDLTSLIPLDEKTILDNLSLGAVDNSSLYRLRPAACPRDPGILSKTTTYCSNLTSPGSRGQAAGRRNLNCQQTLAPTHQSIKLHIFDSIDSTNRFLKELAPSKLIDICCAETQTGGYGRFGRHWHSPYAENIYCSIRWPLGDNRERLSGLSLVLSLAILAALKKFEIHVDIRIKWPNDIYWTNKKLCGSLIEITASDIIIGIGLNVNSITSTQALPKDSWCSLREISGRFLDRNLIIAGLLNDVGGFLKEFFLLGLAPFIPMWNKVDYLQGQRVQVSSLKGQLEGTAQGIDSFGQLILVDQSGATHYLSAGDASLHV